MRLGQGHRWAVAAPAAGALSLAVVAESLGNEACWGGGFSFAECCAAFHGPEGNAQCWDDASGVTYERCCLPPAEGSPRHSRLQRELASELEACQGSFAACVEALAAAIHRADIERAVLREGRALGAARAKHAKTLKDELVAWHARHLAELSDRLPEVLSAYAQPPKKPNDGPPRVAILMACTPSSAGSEGCRLGAALWQCYAHRHGYHFIYDTNEYPSVPKKLRFGADGQESSLGPGVAPLEAVDADFREESTSFLNETPATLWFEPSDFKWWQRWYAARRHLPYYDMLLITDADVAVFPSCTATGLPEALGLDPSDPESWPGAITRDIRAGEDLNGGVMILTRSPWGRLYLELLLAKSRWPLDVAGSGGWCHSRQGAELQSFLELLDLERAASAGRALNRSLAAECIGHALPHVYREKGDQWSMGCGYELYWRCWRRAAAKLAGPPGRRRGRWVRLMDPAAVDLNYRPWSQEPRYALEIPDGEQLPPLARGAFLWHYVGLKDKVGSLLRDFGLSSPADALDCGRLRARFDAWAAAGSGGAGGCSLGGSATPCPYGKGGASAWARGLPPWGC